MVTLREATAEAIDGVADCERWTAADWVVWREVERILRAEMLRPSTLSLRFGPQGSILGVSLQTPKLLVRTRTWSVNEYPVLHALFTLSEMVIYRLTRVPVDVDAIVEVARHEGWTEDDWRMWVAAKGFFDWRGDDETIVLRIFWTEEPRRVSAVTYGQEFDGYNFGSIRTRPGDEKPGLMALLQLASGDNRWRV